ncbi:transglutaminase-like cysteine peptidase [Aliarcobacter butzleri]|uniref:transglutaminase-like cysteine peptidase n=1 Tax=Aliarcobacter butzleri TaxID=28197 RepID=UPI0021B3F012|nr:transglutaminase-like cysteine peptidase [Aliarcobacter butzleri]MCT7562599.1 transglutaminase-like cysteine peptidase [Aliarcobacter butzleri]MCT7588198.1 transglutaminase-like cysteine peptidase [Aliarcobacter butzleri]MCT7612133.1 transglutaminase-like cysteine peptidase [Aliarcobacter butzleri]MCT7621119.1 transglutaminase-like cysteine peptidase [Aliarcobacter butzleri]MCT7626682.1 transglutaminase-like cysteine peptidase [Aliarcobacter butzleri]
MKSLILLVLLLFSNSFAYEFNLNQKDKNLIEKSTQKSFILKRLAKYEEVRNKARNLDVNKKLTQINLFINGSLAEFDNASMGIDDYWMTPKEFFIKGHGDCEDYVIAKYFTLLELGVKKENLYPAIVKVEGSASLHLVLLYVEDKNKSPLVLDNLSFKILPFSKRTDLTPIAAFNEIDSYTLTREKFLQKANVDWGKENKWEKLLNRVYKLDE